MPAPGSRPVAWVASPGPCLQGEGRGEVRPRGGSGPPRPLPLACLLPHGELAHSCSVGEGGFRQGLTQRPSGSAASFCACLGKSVFVAVVSVGGSVSCELFPALNRLW